MGVAFGGIEMDASEAKALRVEYLQLQNNKCPDLNAEIKSEDVQWFLSKLCGVSKKDISNIEIKLNPRCDPDLGDKLDIEVVGDGSKNEQDAFISVIQEYIRIRAKGFSRAFAYASLRQTHGPAKIYDEGSHEFLITKAVSYLPIDWLERLNGSLPLGVLPQVSHLRGDYFVVQDSDISLILAINTASKERLVESCVVDSQTLRSNLQPTFSAAVEKTSDQIKEVGANVPITTYWSLLKETLFSEYGICWKTPLELQRGDYD